MGNSNALIVKYSVKNVEMSHPQLEVCLYQICCICPHPHLQERGCFCCLHANTHQERDVCKAYFWESVQLVVITLSSSLWPLASYMVLCCPQTVLHCVPAVLAPTLPLLATLAPATGPLHLLLFLSAVFFLSQGFFFFLSSIVHITFQSHLLREATLCKTLGASLPSLVIPLPSFLLCCYHYPEFHHLCACAISVVRAESLFPWLLRCCGFATVE